MDEGVIGMKVKEQPVKKGCKRERETRLTRKAKKARKGKGSEEKEREV
jgi:hypothetical protein